MLFRLDWAIPPATPAEDAARLLGQLERCFPYHFVSAPEEGMVSVRMLRRAGAATPADASAPDPLLALGARTARALEELSSGDEALCMLSIHGGPLWVVDKELASTLEGGELAEAEMQVLRLDIPAALLNQLEPTRDTAALFRALDGLGDSCERLN